MTFRIDFRVTPWSVERTYGRNARDCQGIYFDSKAFVFLSMHYDPEDDLTTPHVELIRRIIVTCAHETLHSLVKSGTRSREKRLEREHSAIDRLLLHVHKRD